MFIIINNNNPCHKLLHRDKVKMAKVWWLNLIIELATVSVIHVQKIVTIKITVQKFGKKATDLFCGHSVYIVSATHEIFSVYVFFFFVY